MSDKLKLRVKLDDILQKVSNIVTSWNSTPSDTKYPSEKLVKDSLDTKENSSNKTTALSSSSTDTQYPSAKAVYDTINGLELGGGSYINDYYFDTTTNEIIIDYSNDGSGGSGSGGGSITVDSSLNTSSTNPVQNQAIANAFGKIVEDLDDVNSYYGTLFRLNDVYNTDELVGFGDYLVYSADEDRLFYAKTGNANKDEIATMGDIPSLTDYVQKSSTTGLLKNDGSIMTSGTGATNYAVGNHTHSAYVNPTIADNLTTNDATQVLSAKQGKILNDIIGQAITYINQ